MFHIAVQYSREERYEIHPKKTKVIVKKHHQNAPDPTIMSTWTLGDTHIAPSDNCTHLGVDRYCNAITSDNFILDKVKLARRTAYSLMGAGFHGVNGLGLTTTREMTQLYVTPRLLYGLETLILNIKQREILEVYYRTLLRRLQSLPDTTAIEAIYILAGVLPVEAQLDIKILNFFGKIANLEDSTLRQVALRQLATKELSSNSWFIYVTKIAFKYQLPSTHVMITNPVSESKWKKLVRCHVTNFWKIELQKSAAKKSSLKYLDTNNIQFKQPVHMWVHTQPNLRHVSRTRIRGRLLAGALSLQATRSLFKNKPSNPECLLCNLEPETQEHLLARCVNTHQLRMNLLNPILNLLDTRKAATIMADETLLSQFILDPTATSISHLVPETLHRRIDGMMGNLCYVLHTYRLRMICSANQSDSGPNQCATKVS
jgi:hypothetical protein